MSDLGPDELIDLWKIPFQSQEQKLKQYARLAESIDKLLEEFLPPAPVKVKPSKTDIALLTISPPADWKFSQLKEFTEQVIGWSGIDMWAYSYELRPESGVPHSHIVIRSQNLVALKSQFDRYGKRKKCNVLFQYHTKELNDWSKCITYITKPHGPTETWRASNDIRELYFSNN